jgi:hypothetical protein
MATESLERNHVVLFQTSFENVFGLLERLIVSTVSQHTLFLRLRGSMSFILNREDMKTISAKFLGVSVLPVHGF